MHVTVTGRNIELTPALKDYLTDKLNRAQKHFDQKLEATAILSVAKNPSIAKSQTAEITLKINGTTIRGEESTENMYASIDLVADKVERQLRKYKTRYWSHHDKSLRGALAPETGSEAEAAENEEPSAEQATPRLVRSKKFPLKPMSPEEAAARMDLLGHDFFMFINSESGNVNTVYHRRDGNYGLIEPEA